MGTKYHTNHGMAYEPDCPACAQLDGSFQTMRALDFTSPFWQELCTCGEPRCEHSSGHPHCTWVDDNATMIVEAKCEGFVAVDIRDVTDELREIEQGLR